MQPPVITTVESNPNPAATHTRESSGVSFNLNYVTSPAGILKVLEFLLGLICWALVASQFIPISALQFVLFVTITSWLTTIITLLVFLFGCHAGACSGAPCHIIEFCHNLVWALLYFCAACVLAANTRGGIGQLVAGAVFAFFVAFFYIVHTLVSFKEWRGDFPWN